MAPIISHETISAAITQLVAEEAAAKKNIQKADQLRRRAIEAYAKLEARYQDFEQASKERLRKTKERRKALGAALALDAEEMEQKYVLNIHPRLSGICKFSTLLYPAR